MRAGSHVGGLVHHGGEVERPPVLEDGCSGGVVEGIEDPSRCFCLGVQWNPEYAIDPGDSRILDAFVEATALQIAENARSPCAARS